MSPRTSSIHLSRCNSSILGSQLHNIFNLFETSNKVFFHSLDINSEQFALPNFKSSSRSLRAINGEILNMLIIDFQHRHINLIFIPIFLLANSLEHLITSNGHNTFILSISDHRIGFPWPRLPIREQAAMITLLSVVQDLGADLIEDQLLVCILAAGWLHVPICFLLKPIKGPEGVVEGELPLGFSVVRPQDSHGILHVDNALTTQVFLPGIEGSYPNCYLNTHFWGFNKFIIQI